MFNSVSLTLYFNSRPHGGRHSHGAGIGSSFCISTHALTEGDVDKVPIIPTPSISTHALTEGDSFQKPPEALKRSFQLTPSRRATVYRETIRYNRNISTHALTEGDGAIVGGLVGDAFISTHALTEGDRILSENLSVMGYFNSRPHGGRRPSFCVSLPRSAISTHALTEGDSKFRQIFLLNRGYAYLISLYFLPHFISLLPQILSFQQKSFKFQVRIFLLFSVHLAFALQNQCVHHVKSRFCTNMFYFVFVLFTQIVKPQTIGLFIYDFF